MRKSYQLNRPFSPHIYPNLDEPEPKRGRAPLLLTSYFPIVQNFLAQNASIQWLRY